MLRVVLRLVLSLIAFAIVLPNPVGAQGTNDLVGRWALDRAASTSGPGDPGAPVLEIEFSDREATVRRFFGGVEGPAVWTLPLDGSDPPPPRRGNVQVVNGALIVTHVRKREIVTHQYLASGDTLWVDRSVQPTDGDPSRTLVRHTMVYKRTN